MAFSVQKLIGREETKSAVDRVHYEAQGYSDLKQSSTTDAFSDAPSVAGEVSIELGARIYASSPYVNRGVRVIANQLATVPLRIYIEKGDNEKEEVRDGYPFEMLQYVNPHMTFYELMVHTVSWLSIGTDAYWYVDKTPKEYQPDCPTDICLYPLEPQYVKVIPDPDIGISYYRYEVAGEVRVFEEKNIFHFKNFSPFSREKGFNNLSSLTYDMQVERYAKKMTKNYFSNGSQIDGVITAPGGLDDDEVRKVRRELKNQHAGVSNAHRILMLAKDYTWSPNKPSENSSSIVPMLQNVAETHAMVLGVPLPLLQGVAGGQSKDLLHYEAILWRHTLIPILALIEQTLTKRLALPINAKMKPRLKKSMTLQFDLKDVPALRIEHLDRVRADVADASVGIRTLNEIRKDRNLPTFKGEYAEIGDAPVPYWTDKQAKATASLSISGDPTGRHQDGNGEAQLVDQTGQKYWEDPVFQKIMSEFNLGLD